MESEERLGNTSHLVRHRWPGSTQSTRLVLGTWGVRGGPGCSLRGNPRLALPLGTRCWSHFFVPVS